MNLVDSGWDVFSSFLVFCFGALCAIYLAPIVRVGQWRALFLYLWHTLFCVFYCFYVLSDGGDALSYYRFASNGFVEFGVGTPGVVNVNAFFVAYLGFSILGAFLVNNVFGFIGLLLVYASLSVAVSSAGRFVKGMALLFVLMPSLSFWSSALGKDSISFLSVGLLLFASLDFGKRFYLFCLSIALMFVVRPHMAGIIIISFTFAYVVDSKGSLLVRVALLVLGGVATAAIVPFALDYAGVDGGDLDAVATFVGERQLVNMGGGSSINIADMHPLVRAFSYLFRPMPFDVNTFFQFASSLDNVFLLLVFLWGGCSLFLLKKSYSNEQRFFLWVYAITSLVVLSSTTANLGIAVRQKWMFLPVLAFLFFSVMGSRVIQRGEKSWRPRI